MIISTNQACCQNVLYRVICCCGTCIFQRGDSAWKSQFCHSKQMVAECLAQTRLARLCGIRAHQWNRWEPWSPCTLPGRALRHHGVVGVGGCCRHWWGCLHLGIPPHHLQTEGSYSNPLPPRSLWNPLRRPAHSKQLLWLHRGHALSLDLRICHEIGLGSPSWYFPESSLASRDLFYEGAL